MERATSGAFHRACTAHGGKLTPLSRPALVPSLATFAGYAVSFYFLSLTLRVIPTGIAYAIWSAFGLVLITTVAWLFQGQKLDTAAVVGMAFIMAGVLIMNGFSSSVPH